MELDRTIQDGQALVSNGIQAVPLELTTMKRALAPRTQ
jgi:hypothetical protein